MSRADKIAIAILGVLIYLWWRSHVSGVSSADGTSLTGTSADGNSTSTAAPPDNTDDPPSAPGNTTTTPASTGNAVINAGLYEGTLPYYTYLLDEDEPEDSTWPSGPCAGSPATPGWNNVCYQGTNGTWFSGFDLQDGVISKGSLTPEQPPPSWPTTGPQQGTGVNYGTGASCYDPETGDLTC